MGCRSTRRNVSIIGRAFSQIEAAGFSNVKGLSHHTDGTWRGRAVENGIKVAVVLEPSGQVMVR